jgi:hypothetical protein
MGWQAWDRSSRGDSASGSDTDASRAPTVQASGSGSDVERSPNSRASRYKLPCPAVPRRSSDALGGSKEHRLLGRQAPREQSGVKQDDDAGARPRSASLAHDGLSAPRRAWGSGDGGTELGRRWREAVRGAGGSRRSSGPARNGRFGTVVDEAVKRSRDYPRPWAANAKPYQPDVGAGFTSYKQLSQLQAALRDQLVARPGTAGADGAATTSSEANSTARGPKPRPASASASVTTSSSNVAVPSASSASAVTRARPRPSWRAVGRTVQVGKWMTKASIVKNDWGMGTNWVAASSNLSMLANAIERDGADVNESDELGRTPLMLACSYALSTTVISLLLRKGADPRARSASGWLPLHFVAHNNDSEAAPEMCRLLLEAGADPTIVTDNRHTALTLAKSAAGTRPPLRSQAIVAILERWVRRECPTHDEVRRV